MSRSFFLVFCTPAFRRFSIIIRPKSSGPMIFALRVPSKPTVRFFFSSTLIVRCGERLSTVNGPVTRTRFLSS